MDEKKRIEKSDPPAATGQVAPLKKSVNWITEVSDQVIRRLPSRDIPEVR